MKNDARLLELAWCGWSLLLPEHWRVHKLDGTWRDGAALLGDDEALRLQVKWRRRAPGDPDAGALARRASKAPQATRARGGLELHAARSVPGKKGALHDRWHASNARLLVELSSDAEAPPAIKTLVERDIAPSLALAGPGEPTRWAFLGSLFESPAGFVLDKHSLRLGDHALLLVRGDERMLLRQVAPASLALKRRKRALWLRDEPFARKRRRRLLREDDGALDERTMLPMPLSFLCRRFESTRLQVDESRDRLLLARWEAPAAPGDDAMRALLDAMRDPAREEAVA